MRGLGGPIEVAQKVKTQGKDRRDPEAALRATARPAADRVQRGSEPEYGAR